MRYLNVFDKTEIHKNAWSSLMWFPVVPYVLSTMDHKYGELFLLQDIFSSIHNDSPTVGYIIKAILNRKWLVSLDCKSSCLKQRQWTHAYIGSFGPCETATGFLWNIAYTCVKSRSYHSQQTIFPYRPYMNTLFILLYNIHVLWFAVDSHKPIKTIPFTLLLPQNKADIQKPSYPLEI